MSRFSYQKPFVLEPPARPMRRLPGDYVQLRQWGGQDFLQVDPEGLRQLAREAFRDLAFLLRPGHLRQLARILDDQQASANDREVAATLLQNAIIAARFELPGCQDTGTAIVLGKKGERVLTGTDDAQWLSHGVFDCYQEENLRYSQTAPLSMYEEVNTGTNLPAQIELAAVPGERYDFLFIAKGGGSANKTFLFQETRELLQEERLVAFLVEKMQQLGTAACPPYHIAIVVGGTSAESCLKTVKLASAGELDGLPGSGNAGGQAFRDRELEQTLHQVTRTIGYGAQFGGTAFAHDVRVVRLPRHGASCPVGIGVSCSADRNINARIDRNGIWLEELERQPERYLPAAWRDRADAGLVRFDLDRPMAELCTELAQHPVTTRFALSGTLIVARDIAHARFIERLEQGLPLPEYLLRHPVYYAGPAKTPPGKPAGAFGPTTAGRMDGYVERLQVLGASRIMIAKGNRSPAVTESCRRHGGFYLGSIGGAAAILAEESIRKVECIDFTELGMEAVWRIEVEDFPAFLLVDDKGNDFLRPG